MATVTLNGSEILIETLLEHGVSDVFGYPGGAVLNIYDALYKYRDRITHYLTAHEQGAAHAADGYARATGKAGVCIATSGPGATNLVTGIATAYMDSVPLIAVTGNVAKPLLGKDSFQEVDTTGITMPITKHNFIVKDIEKLAETVRRAFYIALSGRPGPVLVDITKDVTAAEYPYERREPRKISPETDSVTEEDLAEAARLISEAKRPLIYAGGGVISANAADLLKKFAEKIDAPVALTLMGLGAFPDDSPRFTGMVGMHGTKTSNMAVMECDLLIAAGARFSDRVISDVRKFAQEAKVLHLDVDAAEINKNVMTESQVIGDLGEVIKRLLGRLPEMSHKAWLERVGGLKAAYPLPLFEKEDALRPPALLRAVREVMRGAAVTTDVGQHQIWAGQYLGAGFPRGFISSGGLGTMGFGLGAAIGASVARGKRLAVNITGDGSFRMNCVELATAADYKLPVVDIIMNNHALGMVRQWQELFYGGRFSQTDLSRTAADFVKLAEAFGCRGFRIKDAAEARDVLREARASAEGGVPAVVDCWISSDEKVYPMVPPGESIDKVILGE
ncbi:MAG: biosynthetic-type acetolactate synthase large subunit [Clostridiales bacterium]|jgi:acetolactate synthase-1/2/3 large subunit|nr:biosynthetic-type acetolactate synthase large subunit [Clostridiales bacterium]